MMEPRSGGSASPGASAPGCGVLTCESRGAATAAFAQVHPFRSSASSWQLQCRLTPANAAVPTRPFAHVPLPLLLGVWFRTLAVFSLTGVGGGLADRAARAAPLRWLAGPLSAGGSVGRSAPQLQLPEDVVGARSLHDRIIGQASNRGAIRRLSTRLFPADGRNRQPNQCHWGYRQPWAYRQSR